MHTHIQIRMKMRKHAKMNEKKEIKDYELELNYDYD